jgi:hypothetical protein
MIPGEPKQAPKDPELDPHKNRSIIYVMSWGIARGGGA